MKFLSPFVALLFAWVAAPAHAAQDGETAPTTSRPAYSSVVLWAVGYEREDQEIIEHGAIKTFEKKGIRAVAMTDLAVKDQKYSRHELKALIEAAGVSTVFEIVEAGPRGMKPHQSGMGEQIIRAISSKNTGVSTQQGGAGAGGPGLTMAMGGDTLRPKPTRWFSVYVTDITDGQQVWFDTVRVTAREKSKLRVFAGKALRKAAKKTIKEDVFAAAGS